MRVGVLRGLRQIKAPPADLRAQRSALLLYMESVKLVKSVKAGVWQWLTIPNSADESCCVKCAPVLCPVRGCPHYLHRKITLKTPCIFDRQNSSLWKRMLKWSWHPLQTIRLFAEKLSIGALWHVNQAKRVGMPDCQHPSSHQHPMRLLLSLSLWLAPVTLQHHRLAEHQWDWPSVSGEDVQWVRQGGGTIAFLKFATTRECLLWGNIVCNSDA